MAPHKGTETALLKEKIRSKALLEQILRENGPRRDGRRGGRRAGIQNTGNRADPALENPILRLSPDVRRHLTFTRLLKRLRFPQEPEESARQL